MPFYNINEMETKKDKTAPGMAATVVGEFMKVGVMTYEDEIGPPPHFHPNEEQFVLVLEGHHADEIAETYPAFAARVFGDTASVA